MDKFNSTSNYVTAPTKNERARLSNWLTDLVDEVSRKSTSTIQKWIHSSSTTTTDTSGSSENNAIHNKSFTCREEGKQIEFNKKHIGNTISSTIGPTEKIGCSSVSQFKEIGKNKINQLYNLVNQTKESRIQIQDLKMENTVIGSTVCKEIEKPTIMHSSKNTSEINTQTNKMSASNKLLNNELNISEDELPDFENFQRNIKLGLIGRASTVQDMHTLKPLNILCTKKNKNTFVPISRSYSEQQDDEINSEYDNSYILNKRSRSFTHVQKKKELEQDDTNNKQNSNKCDKVSNSLPSFLDCSGSSNSLLKNDDELLSYKRHKNIIMRGNSYQSDSSHCSSVDSLLDSRKPDPEAILINLGFGPMESEDILSKIPKRFLQPSQVKGIDTEAFLRRQQMANNIHDHTVLGYRGLVGNPDIPPSTIVAKIMERFELNERKRGVSDININRPQSAPPNSLDTLKS